MINNDEFNIYPNPAANNFIVELNTTATEIVATIKLFNLIGEEIYFMNATVINGSISERITIQNVIPGGVYIIKVNVGEKEFTSQLIIQK